jgi:hypothetical protein
MNEYDKKGCHTAIDGDEYWGIPDNGRAKVTKE